MIFNKIGQYFRKQKQQNQSNLERNLSFQLSGNNQPLDISFRTYHSNLNDSFWEFQSNFPEPNINEEEINTADLSTPLNQNFTAIFNVPPNKQNKLSELYTIISNQISEKVDSYQNQQSINTIQEEQISYEDFIPYLKRIKTNYMFYQKTLQLNDFMQKSKIQVDKEKEMVNCYQNVPNSYFLEDYHIDFQLFTRKVSEMNKFQDSMSEYLDEIEFNLYYQITSKFEDFLSVIKNLNTMDNQIEISIKKIQAIKQFKNNLKKLVCYHSQKILHLKKKMMKIQETVQLLDMLRIVRKTVPTIQEVVKISNLDQAAELVLYSENIYCQKLKSLSSLKDFNDTLAETKDMLEEKLRKEFQDKALQYILKSLVYHKNETGQGNEVSMMEESFMVNVHKDSNESFIMNHLENANRGELLCWFFSELTYNEKIEENLAKLA